MKNASLTPLQPAVCLTAPVAGPDSPIGDVLLCPHLREYLTAQDSPFVAHNNFGACVFLEASHTFGFLCHLTAIPATIMTLTPKHTNSSLTCVNFPLQMLASWTTMTVWR